MLNNLKLKKPDLCKICDEPLKTFEIRFHNRCYKSAFSYKSGV
jgi:hypothetical protein